MLSRRTYLPAPIARQVYGQSQSYASGYRQVYGTRTVSTPSVTPVVAAQPALIQAAAVQPALARAA